MSHSYTPGLCVTAHTTIRKLRRLPIKGKVVAKVGQMIKAEETVATAQLPGNVATVNVMNILGISANEINSFMLKKIGDLVKADEAIAETKPFFKIFRSSAVSPIEGTLEVISEVTGQVMLRTPPKPVDLNAYIDGEIVEVREQEGVIIETQGTFIQGILGVGGEVCGQIELIDKDRGEPITPDDLNPEMKGKIVVAGSFVSSDVFARANQIGIQGLICSGFNDSDLRVLLGRDLGVAITGNEDVSPIIIITEGFGHIPMAKATFDLLKANNGKRASASGATQIRAGVLRPEIIIPQPDKPNQKAVVQNELGLREGSRVRIIREPYFGQLGLVKSLPPELTQVESETMVRVIEILCDDGRSVIVPRSNVEAIES